MSLRGSERLQIENFENLLFHLLSPSVEEEIPDEKVRIDLTARLLPKLVGKKESN